MILCKSFSPTTANGLTWKTPKASKAFKSMFALQQNLTLNVPKETSCNHTTTTTTTNNNNNNNNHNDKDKDKDNDDNNKNNVFQKEPNHNFNS